MYLGHFAPAFTLLSLFSFIPPAAIIHGVYLMDFFNGIFIILGIDKVSADPYPGGLPYMFFRLDFIDWDHSLASAGVLSILWGLWWSWRIEGDKAKIVGLIAGLSVFSHWIEDFLVHNKDLALYPYSETHFGCGLWGKMGIWAWVAEGMFCVPFVWYAAREYRERGAGGLGKEAAGMAALWVTVSPWGSALRYLAEIDLGGEVVREKIMGVSVLVSFLLPGLFMVKAFEGKNRNIRERERKRVD